MSCDAAAALFLFFASTSPGASPAVAPAVTVAPPTSVATEPLFADIVVRAKGLEAEVKDYRAKVAGGQAMDLAAFGGKIAELSKLDMQGHLTLAERGTDGDLKCILRGISQDLTVKMNDLVAAATPTARDGALKEMGYLLRDNVEVILAPPAPPV
jgi:hypothetical protein